MMPGLQLQLPFLTKKADPSSQNQSSKEQYDLDFIQSIQPQGGISFKDNYIRKGDGYEACIRIYNYPSRVSDKWLKKIVTMKNIVSVIDVSTMDRSETVAAINKSILEQKMRQMNERQATARQDALNTQRQLQNLYQEISQLGEVIKEVHIRLYVHGRTVSELERNVEDILIELQAQGFKGTVFLNEQEYEFKALTSSYSDQSKEINHREGRGMPAITLAAGLPFHYAELNDPRGSYLGTTFTGGNVLFDLFHKDKKRKFYNAAIVGNMGSGKSTTLKKLLLDNALRGNFIRGFDVTGEFETLVTKLNGKIIALDGTDGMINPLQIYRSHTDGKVMSFENQEKHAFLKHLSKVANFYRFLSPDSNDSDIQEFKKVLRDFYDSLGFLEKIQTTGVTTLNNEEYPTFSELLTFVKNILYEDVENRIIKRDMSKTRAERLEKIELVIDGIVHGFGHLFDGHTTIQDITNEQIVFFSVKSLRNLEKEAFNGQMFNTLTMLWDHLIQLGEPQRKAIYKDGFDIDSVIRFLVLIDEAHLFVNSENPLAVNYLTEFAREARKYFGGLIFASQSIRDFVIDVHDSVVANKIKVLFELTQYKFIMQQDPNSLDTLANVFQGQLSDSELKQIPYLSQGECVLAINGLQNLTMQIEASNEELMMFEGGL